MPDRSRKRPRDSNQLARLLVDLSTGDATEPEGKKLDFEGKNPAAVLLGQRGGLKGGKARAASLTPKRRKEIAKKAAAKRWAK
jgi:hypothetical protein